MGHAWYHQHHSREKKERNETTAVRQIYTYLFRVIPLQITSCLISLVVSTPHCGCGNPSSILGLDTMLPTVRLVNIDQG